MRNLILAFVVVFGSLYPASAQTIDPTQAYIAWDYLATETGVDQTTNACVPNVDPTKPPICEEVPLTPTPADAEAFTYRMDLLESPTRPPGTPAIVVLKGITCTVDGCRTPPIATILPGVVEGGSYAIRISRERLPRFHESTWSNLVPFTVGNGEPPPPPVDCVLSDWGAWSAWMPIAGLQEQRIRMRTVLVLPENGGAPCGALSESETRMVITPPPPPPPSGVRIVVTIDVQSNGTVVVGVK